MIMNRSQLQLPPPNRFPRQHITNRLLSLLTPHIMFEAGKWLQDSRGKYNPCFCGICYEKNRGVYIWKKKKYKKRQLRRCPDKRLYTRIWKWHQNWCRIYSVPKNELMPTQNGCGIIRQTVCIRPILRENKRMAVIERDKLLSAVKEIA